MQPTKNAAPVLIGADALRPKPITHKAFVVCDVAVLLPTVSLPSEKWIVSKIQNDGITG